MEQAAVTGRTRFGEMRNFAAADLHAPAPSRPGLEVSLLATVATDGERRWPVVITRVAGNVGTLRLYLYVDGDLAETWIPASTVADYDGRKIPAGRHVVTARAVDAVGRWGGASIVVAVSERSKAFAS